MFILFISPPPCFIRKCFSNVWCACSGTWISHQSSFRLHSLLMALTIIQKQWKVCWRDDENMLWNAGQNSHQMKSIWNAEDIFPEFDKRNSRKCIWISKASKTIWSIDHFRKILLLNVIQTKVMVYFSHDVLLWLSMTRRWILQENFGGQCTIQSVLHDIGSTST